MKKFIFGASAVALVVSAHAAGSLRISQVYGAGGNTGATWNQDYVELLNIGATAFDLTGMSIQYASASNITVVGASQIGAFASGTMIAPNHYFLIYLATGANGVALPVAADATFTGINMSGTSGKVAIVSNTTAITTTDPTTNVLDFVGYGVANTAEGAGYSGAAATPSSTATPATTPTSSLLRKLLGQQDTDNNFNDFTLNDFSQPGAQNPRNSSSAPVPEPTTMVALGLGAIALIRRRRNK